MIHRKKNRFKFLWVALVLLLINMFGSSFFFRWDLTLDKRYSLSPAVLDILQDIQKPMVIKVYLAGDFPANFKRLQIETRRTLEEFKNRNRHIKFVFIDPLKENPVSGHNGQVSALIKAGLAPARLTVEEKGALTAKVIFPWAVVHYDSKKENVSLLKKLTTVDNEIQLSNSIQNLEYAFADAFKKLTLRKRYKIAVLKGNGELEDRYIADFLKSLKAYYRIAPFTLDSVQKNPRKTLYQLSRFDLCIIAKPTERFSEEEKFVLDQYIMRGGKTLWLIDAVQADMDSLMRNGKMPVYAHDLNLTDMLFSYGVRIKPNIVLDKFAALQRFVVGNIGDQVQYKDLPWHYFPLIFPRSNHPVVNHIDAVRLQFANSIDTLKNATQKKVLLQSSDFTRIQRVPSQVDIASLQKKTDDRAFHSGSKILAVLIEGAFNSAFKNRIKPFEPDTVKNTSVLNKMIVVADGDIIANQLDKGVPLRLGYDKWTNRYYGNKEFLMHAVAYLINASGIINIRSKKTVLPLLDKKAVTEHTMFFQAINTVAAFIFFMVFSMVVHFIRKKTFS